MCRSLEWGQLLLWRCRASTIALQPFHCSQPHRRLMPCIYAEACCCCFCCCGCQATHNNPRWDPTQPCSSRLPSPWDEVIAPHFLCLAALVKGNRVEAYNHLAACVQPFLRVSEPVPPLPTPPEATPQLHSNGGASIPLTPTPFLHRQSFRTDSSAWCIEPMHGLVHNVHNVAAAADAELKSAGKKPSKAWRRPCYDPPTTPRPSPRQRLTPHRHRQYHCHKQGYSICMNCGVSPYSAHFRAPSMIPPPAPPPPRAPLIPPPDIPSPAAH